MADLYNTGHNLEHLMIETKAATVFAAQETSLFMGGALVPMSTVPAGSMTLKVPKMDALTAPTGLDDTSFSGDLAVSLLTDDSVSITPKTYAARSVLRDIGGVDPMDIGRVLGNSVAEAFDKSIMTTLEGLTQQELADASGLITIDDIFDAVATIRGNGEFGALKGVISPAAAAKLMKEIGTSAYAGGDVQSEAVRNGWVGRIGGVDLYQSAFVGHTVATTKGMIWADNAVRIGMFRPMDIEMQRRAEAIGMDIVASVAAGSAVIDAGRGVEFVNLV